ncbi:SPOSA6832_00931, partial [Sporobolomyces salmonicolor]
MNSDDEVPRGTGGGDDDVALPKATVNKLIQGPLPPSLDWLAAAHHWVPTELLPPGFTAAKEVKDLMAECCKGKPPLPASHGSRRLTFALCVATEFVLAVSSEANEICEKDSKKTMLPEHIVASLKALGFEDFVEGVEDVLKDHKELAKGERQKKAKKAAASGMTEEELLRAQEELFAASRARFEAGGTAAPAEDQA